MSVIYKRLTSSITTFLDSTADPMDRLRHIRGIQVALTELLDTEQARCVRQLQAQGRFDTPAARELMRQVNLGTVQTPSIVSRDLDGVLQQPAVPSSSLSVPLDVTMTADAQ